MQSAAELCRLWAWLCVAELLITAVWDEVGAEDPVSVVDEGVTECASRWVRIEVGSWFERMVAHAGNVGSVDLSGGAARSQGRRCG